MQTKMILEYNSKMQETMMKKNDKMLLKFCNYQIGNFNSYLYIARYT